MKKAATFGLILSLFLQGVAPALVYGQEEVNLTDNTQVIATNVESSTSEEVSKITPEIKTDSLGNILSEDDIKKAKVSVDNLRSAYNASDLSKALETGGGVTVNGPIKPKVVGSTGAMEYAYDFKIPAGRLGMNPKVSFTYNSQISNNQNYLGYGFQSSIPYIQRLNTKGVENLYVTENFTSNVYDDLVQATSTGIFYSRLNDDTWAQMSRVGNTWEVKDNRGMTYVYGGVADARVQNTTASTSQIYAWYLTDTFDSSGNNIHYTYTKDNNFVYPQSITYTNNVNVQGIYKVVFNWETRPDMLESYQSGFKVKNTLRLQNIEARTNNQLSNKTTFRYISGTNGVRSLLAGITETSYSENNTSATFPEMTLQYSQPVTENVILDRDYKIDRATDINGDGLLDFVYARVFYGIDNNSNRREEKILYINRRTSFETIPLLDATTNCVVPWTATCNILPETQIPFSLSVYNTGQTYSDQTFLAEVDGDGYLDVVKLLSGFKGTPTKSQNAVGGNQVITATSSLFHPQYPVS